MNKKADLLLISIFLIVIVMLILMLIDNFTLRGGCRSDVECGENYYCGVDHECHKHPIIERETIKESVSYDLTGPALILGVAIIIGAIVLKWKQETHQ